MISLIVGVLITAAAVDTLQRIGLVIGMLGATVTAVILLLRRGFRAIKIIEALADLPESQQQTRRAVRRTKREVARMQQDIDHLRAADEEQANDHAQVKSLLEKVDAQVEELRATLDAKVAQVAEVGEANHERLSALERDLGVDFTARR